MPGRGYLLPPPPIAARLATNGPLSTANVTHLAHKDQWHNSCLLCDQLGILVFWGSAEYRAV